MHYLSPEWLEAAAAAVARVEGPSGAVTVIGQRVTGAPTGTVDYRLVVDAGRCRLVVGAEPPAEVTLTTPYELAVEIAAGRASAQEAFLHGLISVAGDPTVLMDHAPLAASLADALGAVPVELPDRP